MRPRCHICSSDSDFLLNKDDFYLYRCSGCGLVFVYPQPTSDFLKEKIYSAESGYQANRVEDLSRIPETKRAKKVLSFFESTGSKGKILDVGCSGGHFMYWSKKRGFEATGVELNKKTADSAKAHGFEVYNGFLNDAPFQKNYFDFLFLGEVIEHVNDPRQLIKESCEFLKPQGVIALTTPNIDCFWSKATLWLYKVFKIPWSSATPPHHLYLFNPRNLDTLLLQEGFGLVHKDFLLMTRLKYELGMMHLLKRFKTSKKIKDFVFMILSFSLYFLVYIFNIILSPFMKKDFNMIRIYKKEAE